MSAKNMDVFSLREAVVGEYQKFATSFTTIHAPDIRQQVEAIYSEGRFWPDPLIQINPSYKRGETLAALIAGGALDAKTSDIFRINGAPISLHKHQEQAVALAASGESYVVTTGTGSGKSLCFFIPIVSSILAEKRRDSAKRTRAIVIYPMNALANSQLEELDKFVGNVVGTRPITFARYTGQEAEEERVRISENPPDILLTNFMMLELLMTRQDPLDRKVIGNCAGLRFLVLDELHTYRGRQGADVALLVRRVRERLAPDKLQCIGTSATMASEGSIDDKNRIVAGVASKLFSQPIAESNVIVESLDRVTDASLDSKSVKSKLGAAINAGVRTGLSDAELRSDPLAIWVETRLGIEWSEIDQRWIRARPLTLDEATRALSEDSGKGVDECSKALQELLIQSSQPERERIKSSDASEKSFFAFKLHQFISGAGHAFATLEPPDARKVTVEGQQFLPGAPEKRLYPVHFCRDCGHEYHPVRQVSESGNRILYARDIDDAPIRGEDDDASEDGEQASDNEIFGFVTLHARDEEFSFSDREEFYPEAWLDFDAAGNPRIKPNYRPYRVREIAVAPSGKVGSGAQAWFIPGRFRFCLRCGATHSSAARDRTRLATLSAEGRSSATTVLVASALRWMHSEDSGLSEYTRKLLGFTDNRQDAALQSGHFNDFLFVSMIRAGFLGALDEAGASGLRSDALGAAQFHALGFNRTDPELRTEWLLEPTLKGFNLQEAEATLRQVLAYRVWFDQRRGWRYTNPNLEQLKLVEVDYLGLQDLAADEDVFASAPDVLRYATPATRAAVYRELFDHLRKWMAVRSQVLEPATIEQLLQRSHSRIRSPWGFGSDEKPRGARWLMISAPSRRDTGMRDEDLIVRGGSRSAFGRLLRSSKTEKGETRPHWFDPEAMRALKSKDVDGLIEALLRAACTHGLVSEEATPFNGVTGFRLNDACVLFKRVVSTDRNSRTNKDAFFRDLYASLAATLRQPAHPLFGFEAREHTAQVDGERRALREKRFRFGDKERQELASGNQLRETGESSRFLPILFCSPTMELGVDISALNVVYLRNVPPTPANYAQRSGRAGRSGQAALVLTYSSSQSPHDQYFFRSPRNMVHGAVRPPQLDLANRDLIESHLWAVWLACTEVPLKASIAEMLVLTEPNRPLKTEIMNDLAVPRAAEEARRRIQAVLQMLSDDLTKEDAPWYPGAAAFASDVVARALARFDAAFGRWRDLFLSAEQQRDSARRTMDDYSAPPREKNSAKSRHAQAIDQLALLQGGTTSLSSDFYIYRYLATEGFLPGYNFPRLPLMAYIPATNDGRGGRQTYLQRPRFLALAEFGPRSLVYHEGRAFRVNRAMLSLEKRGSSAADSRLPTETVRICKSCGAGHWKDDISMCHGCGISLGDAEIVNHTYRIENVATQPAERITANDEERQRQGFELQTTFRWATRDNLLDLRRGAAVEAAEEVASLVYGPGAEITRLNKGLRRRRNRTQLGFRIDPLSGYWAKNEDETEEANDMDKAAKQWIVPMVRDRKNALLIQPAGISDSQSTLATVQHALMRGIESLFQLEEGEILAEPMPTRDARHGFLFYEATEGGAGVLTRLLAESERLAEVAQEALRIMHFDLDAGIPSDSKTLHDVPDATCVAACYRCVMSYYNQPDHELLDRRDEVARNFILRLARAKVTISGSAIAPATGASLATAPVPQGNTAQWLGKARGHDLPTPDAEALSVGSQTIPLVWRKHYVAAVFEALSTDIMTSLNDKGFEVVVLGADEAAWSASMSQMQALLGRSK